MVARYIAGCLGLLALGCAIAAAVETKWYSVTLSGTTIDYGLFRSCANSTCEDTKYPDFNGVCTRSDADKRWLGIKITAIIGMAMSFVGALTALSQAKRFAVMRIVALLLASLGTGFAGGFAVYFLQYWYFCDTTPCKMWATTGITSCSDGIVYSLYLQLAATGCNFIGLVFGAVALIQLPPEKSGGGAAVAAAASSSADGAQPPAERQLEFVDESPRDDAQQQQQQQPQESHQNGDLQHDVVQKQQQGEQPVEEAVPELPEGDWIFDEASGMYWSEEAYLFLHLESGWFYDPNGYWYDGENWIAAEE